MTIVWVSMDMGKGISSKFVGGAMGLLMTLNCLRLIWSMHHIYYSVDYSHVSEAALSMLVFCCLDAFINCLLILVWGSCKGLVFQELESMCVSHEPH